MSLDLDIERSDATAVILDIPLRARANGGRVCRNNLGAAPSWIQRAFLSPDGATETPMAPRAIFPAPEYHPPPPGGSLPGAHVIHCGDSHARLRHPSDTQAAQARQTTDPAHRQRRSSPLRQPEMLARAGK